jgi:hypothetical protein
VPSLSDLCAPATEAAAYVLLVGGTLAVVVALAVGDAAWIRASGLVLGTGTLAFALALARPLRLLARRGASSEAPGQLVVVGTTRSA